jgi:DNA helicase-2/ATP-dependent DNA helicase PcrA
MSQAEDKYEKKLFSKISASEKPARIALADLEQQADFVCQRIMDLREEGVPLSEIAVLFRNAYHSNELEVALTQGNIPFKKYGGIRFAEAAHIKDVLAFLKVWHNPLDLISLQRILLLLEGIGPGIAQRLIQQEHTLGEWDLSQYSKKKFSVALKQLQELYSFLKRNDTSLLMGMEKILAFYTPYLNQIFDDANRRIKDIESLESMAKNQNSLESFLSEMSLDPPSTLDEDEFDEDEFLTLSTIHSAKGLEFHSVFFLSAVEGAIPSPWSKDEKDLEEELRLFYVACTRAKTSLYLCVPDDFHQSALKAAGLFFAEPSRFIQTKNILNVVEDWEIE